MGVDYQKLNNVLSNLNLLRNKPYVHREVVHEINDDEGSQGDSNEIYEIYDIGLEDGTLLKIRIGSDSYGDDERIDGVMFVKAKEKTIKVYE